MIIDEIGDKERSRALLDSIIKELQSDIDIGAGTVGLEIDDFSDN